jgi:3-isopropylmalate/(R)-2-methylmalate dehydratase small subunit
MEKFQSLTAIAAPLLRDNIDTDVIIRIEHLVGSAVQGALGRWCFEVLRYKADGSENPDFILNQPPYRSAQILLAGENFGCGSSREAAVWALMEAGFRCVIASSFGDIFTNNCFQNGLLPVALGAGEIRNMAAQVEADPENNRITIDLESCLVITPDQRRLPFRIPQMRRDAFLYGLDEVELTLRRSADMSAFQARDRLARPRIYDLAG